MVIVVKLLTLIRPDHGNSYGFGAIVFTLLANMESP